MVTIRCHFDGKSLVPDEPVELPQGEELLAHVERKAVLTEEPQPSALEWLYANPIDDPEIPEDLAYQHDHYLYGTPKKP